MLPMKDLAHHGTSPRRSSKSFAHTQVVFDAENSRVGFATVDCATLRELFFLLRRDFGVSGTALRSSEVCHGE